MTAPLSGSHARRPGAFLLLFLLVATMAIGAACRSAEPADGRPQVVATTAIIAALARPVAGNLLQVTPLVAAGVDPHDFEAKPADLRRIRGAALVLRHGLGLDNFLDKMLTASGQARVVTVTDGLTVFTARDEQGRTAPDPHVWHDPTLDQAMVARIAQAFAELDPPNAQRYQENARTYQATLEQTDAEVRRIIETIPAANRKMVTDHDAFGYFIRRYGLEFVGAVMPGVTTGTDPSARDLAALEQVIRSQRVRAIFSEGSVDPKVARRVATDTGVTVVDDLYGDTLGDPGSGAETVDGMLLANAKRIAEALK